ncbi:MAG: hypothetical protein ACR2LE_08005 [Nocardioidaceae bacterium]
MQRSIVRILTLFAVSLGLVVGGLGAADASAPASQAAKASDKGFTRVAISPAVVGLVTSAGITASPIGGATAFGYRSTVAFRFPIKSVHHNRISHTGGLRLQSDQAWLALKRFRINLNQGTVSALANNAIRIPVFTTAKSHRPKLGNVRLDLTTQAAKALNNFFLPDAFHGGDTFGYARVFAK